MTVLGAYASTQTAVSGSWTTPENITGANNAAFGYCTIATSGGTADRDTGGFDFSAIPAGSTINSVNITIWHYVANATRMAASSAMVYVNSAQVGSTQTLTKTTTTTNSDTFAVSLTLAQLQDSTLEVRLRGQHATGSTTSSTARFDAVYIEVDYTAATTDKSSADTAVGTDLGYTDQRQSLFEGQTPGSWASNSLNYTMGTKFRPLVDGQIVAIRYYHGGTQNGSCTMRLSLWDNSGTRLATTTLAVTAATSVGWKSVDLPSPVDVTAGTTYMVTMYSGITNFYFANTAGLHTNAIQNGPLYAFAYNDAVEGNGWYQDGTNQEVWPTTKHASGYGYFVDPVFQINLNADKSGDDTRTAAEATILSVTVSSADTATAVEEATAGEAPIDVSSADVAFADEGLWVEKPGTGGAPTLAATPFTQSQYRNQTNITTTFTPQVGELIVVKGVTENSTHTMTAAISGGATTLTQRVLHNTSNDCWAAIWTAVITSSVSTTITLTPQTASSSHSAVVERWNNGALDATPATANVASDTDCSSTITTEADNSVVSWCVGDWSAVSYTTHTWRSGASEELVCGVANTDYSAYFAYQSAPTAGSQTFGLSAPTGMDAAMLAIEIQGTGSTPGENIVMVTERSRTTESEAAEQGDGSATKAGSDVRTATEAASLSATGTASDVRTATEAASLAATSSTPDTRPAATEAASLAATLPTQGDVRPAATSGQSLEASMVGSDTRPAPTEAVTLTVVLATGDTAHAVEDQTRVDLGNVAVGSDTRPAATEGQSLVAQVTPQESASGASQTASVAAQVGSVQPGAGSEQASLLASVPSQPESSGHTEAATLVVSVTAADIAACAEAVSLLAGLSGSDVRPAATESHTLDAGGAKTVVETANTLESGSVARTSATGETRPVADSASLLATPPGQSQAGVSFDSAVLAVAITQVQLCSATETASLESSMVADEPVEFAEQALLVAIISASDLVAAAEATSLITGGTRNWHGISATSDAAGVMTVNVQLSGGREATIRIKRLEG